MARTIVFTVTFMVLWTSILRAELDCSHISMEAAREAILSKFLLENASFPSDEVAGVLQTNRLKILDQLGDLKATSVQSAFTDNLRFSSMLFANGSITIILSCSQESGLQVKAGEYHLIKTNQFGSL